MNLSAISYSNGSRHRFGDMLLSAELAPRTNAYEFARVRLALFLFGLGVKCRVGAKPTDSTAPYGPKAMPSNLYLASKGPDYPRA